MNNIYIDFFSIRGKTRERERERERERAKESMKKESEQETQREREREREWGDVPSNVRACVCRHRLA